jgi:hypothetical protein
LHRLLQFPNPPLKILILSLNDADLFLRVAMYAVDGMESLSGGCTGIDWDKEEFDG